MPKRARSDRLTGGTGDVNPQFMGGTLTMSGANTTTSKAIEMPITRMPGTGGRVTIVELLKVFIEFGVFPSGAPGAYTEYKLKAYFSTINWDTTSVSYDDSTVFAASQVMAKSFYLVTGGGGMSEAPVNPVMIDVTDGVGHGILLAGDNVYLQLQSAAYGSAAVVRWKFLYRFKKVSLSEYVGIVQSQSQ